MGEAGEERAAIEQLRRGDIDGLAVLVRRYQLRAVRAANLIVRDRPLAEDIVQTAFLRAYARIDQFDPSRPFGPWFLRVVVNDALKAARRADRLVPLAGDENGVSAPALRSQGSSSAATENGLSILTRVVFPATGCRMVTARYQGVTLDFVV